MRTIEAVRTSAHRKRIERMIRDIENIEMNVNDKNDEFDSLMNHII